MNTTIKDIMTRRSVRDFSARKIERADMETILAAGLSAPSAHGKGPWHLAVLQDRRVRERIASRMAWFKPTVDAPAAILVLGDPKACVQQEYWTVDCALLSGNLMLAARSLGIGSVLCGISPVEDNVAAVRSVLDIPGGLVPFCMIALGYPADPSAFRERVGADVGARVTWDPEWAAR